MEESTANSTSDVGQKRLKQDKRGKKLCVAVKLSKQIDMLCDIVESRKCMKHNDLP